MFTTTRSEPEWLTLYDAIKSLDADEPITFEQLDELLDREFRSNRSPIYRVMRKLETDDRKTLIAMPNVGYRVAQAREHEKLARSHHRRGRNQLRRAVSRAASANRAGLTLEERRRVDDIELNLNIQADMIRRLDSRVSRVERKTDQTAQEHEATAQRVAELELLLRRHGIEPE